MERRLTPQQLAEFREFWHRLHLHHGDNDELLAIVRYLGLHTSIVTESLERALEVRHRWEDHAPIAEEIANKIALLAANTVGRNLESLSHERTMAERVRLELVIDAAAQKREIEKHTAELIEQATGTLMHRQLFFACAILATVLAGMITTQILLRYS